MTITDKPGHKHTAITSKRVMGSDGRTVTDHSWVCSCGERSAPPNGFSHRSEADVNYFFHQKDAVRADRVAAARNSFPGLIGYNPVV